MARMTAMLACAALLLAACDGDVAPRPDVARPDPSAPAVVPDAPDRPPDSAPVDPGDTGDTGDTGDMVRPPPADGADAAASVLRDYFELVAAGRHADARALWAPGTTGETLEPLVEGDTGAGSISATVGTPGRIEGAAGSRYVSIPVSLEVVGHDGSVQHAEGSYVLRRSVVDGATPEQRRWRIHSADLR